jgi:hypothetical protein
MQWQTNGCRQSACFQTPWGGRSSTGRPRSSVGQPSPFATVRPRRRSVAPPIGTDGARVSPRSEPPTVFSDSVDHHVARVRQQNSDQFPITRSDLITTPATSASTDMPTPHRAGLSRCPEDYSRTSGQHPPIRVGLPDSGEKVDIRRPQVSPSERIERWVRAPCGAVELGKSVRVIERSTRGTDVVKPHIASGEPVVRLHLHRRQAVPVGKGEDPCHNTSG